MFIFLTNSVNGQVNRHQTRTKYPISTFEITFCKWLIAQVLYEISSKKSDFKIRQLQYQIKKPKSKIQNVSLFFVTDQDHIDLTN